MNGHIHGNDGRKNHHYSYKLIKGEDMHDSNSKDSMIESKGKHTNTRASEQINSSFRSSNPRRAFSGADISITMENFPITLFLAVV